MDKQKIRVLNKNLSYKINDKNKSTFQSIKYDYFINIIFNNEAYIDNIHANNIIELESKIRNKYKNNHKPTLSEIKEKSDLYSENELKMEDKMIKSLIEFQKGLSGNIIEDNFNWMIYEDYNYGNRFIIKFNDSKVIIETDDLIDSLENNYDDEKEIKEVYFNELKSLLQEINPQIQNLKKSEFISNIFVRGDKDISYTNRILYQYNPNDKKELSDFLNKQKELKKYYNMQQKIDKQRFMKSLQF